MRKPFNDPRVRQALNYAVDKQAFIKVVFSGSRGSDGFADAAAAGVLPEAGRYAYDPAKAKALLAEAGYPNGFETTLTGGYRHAGATRHAVRAAAACARWA